MSLNDIPTKQVQPQFVDLLRARYRTYRAAKLMQGILVLSTIALPVGSVLLAPTYPITKAYFALAALVLLLLDTGLIERQQKDRMKRGAKLQEEFDIKVLGLPWNYFVAGTMVDHEDIHALSAKHLSKKRESKLTNWYDPCVGEVSLPIGRLVCQRTNIAYDSRLRKRYSSALLYATIGLGIVLLIFGLAYDLKLPELVLALLVPITPLINWTMREHRKQTDTVNALSVLKSEFEKLWQKALADISTEELGRGSRELQDAIYQHRASSTLVFDWIYDLLRSTNEREASHAAQKLISQAKSVSEGRAKV